MVELIRGGEERSELLFQDLYEGSRTIVHFLSIDSQ